MKNNKLALLLGCFSLVLLIAGASILYSRLSQEVTPTAPTVSTENSEATAQTQPANRIKAPDFTVYDADSNAVHLSDFIGKPVVLNFWASWCGPCKYEMPNFEEFCTKLDGKVQFLMINMTGGYQETVGRASKFIEQQGYTFPVYYDIQSDAAMTYGIYSIPVSLFVAADGSLSKGYIGALNASIIQTCIEEILP